LPVEPFSDVFIEFSCAWRYANARTGKLQFQLRQDTNDITIIDNAQTGASHTYNPAIDHNGMVFKIFIVDGQVVEQGGTTFTGNPPVEVNFPNVGQDLKFTGTSKYNVVWGETDVTRYDGNFMTTGVIQWQLLDKNKIDGKPDRMDIRVTRKKADAFLP
jgi:hypothetical protein